MVKIKLPCDKNQLKQLHAGDFAELSGIVYMARDAAHKRITEMINNGQKPPFELEGATIYYAGPCPLPEKHPDGWVFGACGPTTSGRMDIYTPMLLDAGVVCMIGKGERSGKVNEAIARNGCVYFATPGGAGALLAEKIKSEEIVAFSELGAEAVRKIVISDFPVIVATDAEGNSIYL